MKNIDEFTIFDVGDYLKHRYQAIDLILREALNNRRVYPITTSNVCLCAQLKSEFTLWDWEVFRNYWFTPERFDIEYLYKHFFRLKSPDVRPDIHISEDNTLWERYHISEVPSNKRRACYWFPLTGEYAQNRLEILEKAVIKFEEQYGKGNSDM